MFVDSTVYSGDCSCGRSHDMVTKAAVIESGALFRFEEYAKRFGLSGKRCVLYDENTYAATEGRHPFGEQEIVMCPENLHANEISTAWVLERLENDVEVIIAVGSGTVHDVARFCAHERGIHFVSCPTGASVDGFCSTVAAMTWHGFKKNAARGGSGLCYRRYRYNQERSSRTGQERSRRYSCKIYRSC